LDPDILETWGTKGNVLNQLKYYEEALKCYNKVLELDPNDVNGWYKKGYTLMKLGKNQEALKCFNKVLELNHDDEDAKKYKEELLSSKDENVVSKHSNFRMQ